MTAIWRISSEVTTDSTVLPDNTTRQVYIALNADHFPIAFKLKTGREPKSEKPAQLRSRTTRSSTSQTWLPLRQEHYYIPMCDDNQDTRKAK